MFFGNQLTHTSISYDMIFIRHIFVHCNWVAIRWQ